MKLISTTQRSARPVLLLILFSSLNLFLAACGGAAISPTATPPPSSATPTANPINTPNSPVNRSAGAVYAGWAIDAYPDMSREQMKRDLSRMKEAGANVVWLSHSNPAHSYAKEREVGINPAVWSSFRDFSQLTHNDAVAIVKGQERMLEVCRELGLKAVLSVGYHTQMGEQWNKQNPQHLRRSANGKIWQASAGTDPYGSPYSPVFQKDLKDYYTWVEYEFVSEFSDVIMMLNLADEPLGGDYSSWAEQEFKRRTSYGFGEVGSDPTRQGALGEFQAGVMVDFMKLAAGYWQEIKPGLPVTMSFDGGAMRVDEGLTNLERLFRDAPANFVVSFDMYARDRGNLSLAVQQEDITRLIFLTRAIGGYSAQYGRKVWLWSAANSWGLGQPPVTIIEPGTIADAQVNLLYLALLMNQTGGHLEGLAVWNYNIRTQGLYNYDVGMPGNKALWKEDEMFERVSQKFATVRSIMSQSAGQPQVVFLRSPQWQYEAIGANQADYAAKQIDWARLDVLARNNLVSIEAGQWPSQLPASWTGLKTVVVISPAEYLSEKERAGLRGWTEKGGTLVASLGVVQAVTGQSLAAWNGAPTPQAFGLGRIFASREPTHQLFDSSKAASLRTFWRDLFGLSESGGGYLISTPGTYLHYNLGHMAVVPRWPSNRDTFERYRSDGTPQLFNQQSKPDWPLQRSEFIFAHT